MKHLNTGELEFESFEESSQYFAQLLADAEKVKSTNTVNAETYKNEIVELRNVGYSIPMGKVLSSNAYYTPTPFWSISESVSEMLGLKRPIMERYRPDIMDWAYFMHPNRTPDYSYGERWGLEQQHINMFEKLDKNPTSKRAVMVIYNGSDTFPCKKEVPCTILHQFSSRNDKLDVTAYYRSWDFNNGGIFDIFLANFLGKSMLSWLNASEQPQLLPGNLHFVANSLHYYPSKSQEKLEKMLAIGETDFYSDVQPFSLNVDINTYFKDLYHLQDAEQASYNGNFEYAEQKLEKIVEPVFRDFTRMYMIKNAKTHKQEALKEKYEDAVEVPEMRKWFNA